MKMSMERINLLPEAYKQAEQIRRRLSIMGGLLMLESVFFIGCLVIPLKIEMQEASSQLEAVSLELDNDSFKEVNQVTRQLEEAKIQKEQWSEKYAKIKQKSFINTRLLDSVLSRLPFQLTINKLSIFQQYQDAPNLERTILIQGTSQEMLAIFTYATLLESLYGVGTTHYEISYEEAKEQYGYQISVHMLEKVLESEKYTQEIDLINDGGESW